MLLHSLPRISRVQSFDNKYTKRIIIIKAIISVRLSHGPYKDSGRIKKRAHRIRSERTQWRTRDLFIFFFVAGSGFLNENHVET